MNTEKPTVTLQIYSAAPLHFDCKIHVIYQYIYVCKQYMSYTRYDTVIIPPYM